MCSPDLRGERRAVSSGKTLSSFVRSAVHVVDSLRARLPSLFDRRVFPTTPVFRFCLSFLFVHASSRARYTPRLVLLEKSPFISLQMIPASIVFPLSAAFVLSTFPAVALSLSRFSTHFFVFPLSSDSPPSRPLSRPFIISLQPSRVRFCFTTLSPIVFLSPSQPLECLSSTSLFAPCLLSPTIVLCLYLSPFPCPTSFSLSLFSYLPPTHAHPPPSSSAGSVRIGPAR